MSREWKPGDVAEAECMGMTVRGIVDTDGRFYTTDQRVKGISSSAFALEKLRPLAVFDPEDRRECQRLLIAICKAAGITMPTILGTDAMQAALREFANPTPPKPEEPMDLAVRVFADGTNWAKVGYWWVSPSAEHAPREWDWLTERDDFEAVSP